MSGSVSAFRPSANAVAISATTASASEPLPPSGDVALIYNASSPTSGTNAFVAFGAGSATASTTSGVVIPPGGTLLVHVGPYVDHVAALVSTGTATVYVTRGNGTQH